MSTIKFDANKMQNKVVPQLNNSIKGLKSAAEIISGIQVPSDFSYSKMLKGFTSEINSIKKEVNNAYKWTNDIVKKFQDAEKKNAAIISGIASGTSKKKLTYQASAYATGENKVESVRYALGGIDLTGTSTGAKVSEVSLKNAFEGLGEGLLDAVGTVVSSAGNVVVSLVKGVGELLQSLVKAATLLVTGVFSVFTGALDGISYLANLATGTTENFESATVEMWKGVMGFVATDYVENAYKSFYENTLIGKCLDEHAHDWFKSDGVVSNVISGIGYVAGIAIITYFTAGLGTAVTGAASVGGATGAAIGGAAGATSVASNVTVSAIISGFSAFGKYTGEYWEKVKNSSWENIKEMYKNGEIDEKDYEQYQKIRNLSDEEWKELTEQYKNGNISKDDYEKIKVIREMPENWENLSNATKGIGYGFLNGLWEGVQWFAGGKLGDWTIKTGSKLATSAVRVGVDTGFNGLDTPFRAVLDMLTSDVSWKEAWEKQGGWFSVLTNIGVGLIGSVGGEVFDGMKTSKDGNMTANSTVENIIDPEHGFQLNMDDLGLVQRAMLEHGDKERVQNILNNVNNKGFLDEQTGKFLKSLFDDDNSRILIKTIKSTDADSIMNEGIRCLGNSTSIGGAIPRTISDINLENTVTDVTTEGLIGLISRLKSANGVSQGMNPIDGAIILKIPKDAQIEDIFKYNSELDLFNIDPRYNIGFVKNIGDGKLESIKIKNVLEYSNNFADASFNIYQINTIDDAIKVTLQKQGLPLTAKNIQKLKNAIANGNYDQITRTMGAREFVINYMNGKGIGQISDLMDVINTGDVSDPRVVNLIRNSFDDWLEKNNPYAERLINKLIELKKTYPNLTWKVDADGLSYWNGKTLFLGENQINWGDSGTYAHETGHLLFDLVLGEQLPDNWDDIVAKARVISSRTNNRRLHSVIKSLKDHESINYSKAMSSFESKIKSAGYKSIDDYVDAWAKSIEYNLNTTGLHDTIQTLRNAGFKEEVIKLLKEPDISFRDVATQDVNTKVKGIKECFDRLQEGGADCAVSDIISSVYEGTRFDLNGNYLGYTYCHEADYYLKDGKLSFHEIIANFTQLKMSGNTKALKQIRTIFGDEFYLALEDIFNKLLE